MKKIYSSLVLSLCLFSIQAQNVGVGTANPLSKLNVSEGTIINDNYAAGAGLNLWRAEGTQALPSDLTTNTAIIGNLNFGYRIGGNFGNFARIRAILDETASSATDAPAALSFWTTANGSGTVTERMRISGDGNVGIGTVVPTARLHINAGTLGIGRQDNGDVTPYMQLGLDDGYTQYIGNNAIYNSITDQWNYVATGGYGGLASTIRQSSGVITFSTASGGVNPMTLNERLRIANNGNIGIADDNPQTLVSVQSLGERLHIFRPADNSMAIQVSIDNQWAARTTYASGCCNTLSLQPDVGNVGIGTTSPSERLHVNGNIFSNGSINFGTATRQMVNLWGTSYGIGVQNNTQYFRTATHFAWYIGGSHNDAVFNSGGGTAAMVIRNNAAQPRVGIGTTDPEATLHVVGGNRNISSNSGRRFTFNTFDNGNVTAVPNMVAYFQGDVMTNLGFYALNTPNFSDVRIKNIIGKSDTKQDLQTLNKIEITDYRHIDTLWGDKAIHKKVIAQQVEKVFPNAIHEKANYIPNVYELSKKIEIKNDEVVIELSKNHDLIVGDKIKCIMPDETERFITVKETLGNNKLVAEKFDGAINVDELFIYGKKVNDFKSVDYNAIAMLNVSATQELYKLIKEQQLLIEKLQTDNANKEINIAELNKKYDALNTELMIIKNLLIDQQSKASVK